MAHTYAECHPLFEAQPPYPFLEHVPTPASSCSLLALYIAFSVRLLCLSLSALPCERLWPPRGQTLSQIPFLSSGICVWFNRFLQSCDWVKVLLKWFHRGKKKKEGGEAHLSRHCHRHYQDQEKVWENAVRVPDNLILDISSFMINTIWLWYNPSFITCISRSFPEWWKPYWKGNYSTQWNVQKG